MKADGRDRQQPRQGFAESLIRGSRISTLEPGFTTPGHSRATSIAPSDARDRPRRGAAAGGGA
jgi:hypothetical protein